MDGGALNDDDGSKSGVVPVFGRVPSATDDDTLLQKTIERSFPFDHLEHERGGTVVPRGHDGDDDGVGGGGVDAAGAPAAASSSEDDDDDEASFDPRTIVHGAVEVPLLLDDDDGDAPPTRLSFAARTPNPEDGRWDARFASRLVARGDLGGARGYSALGYRASDRTHLRAAAEVGPEAKVSVEPSWRTVDGATTVSCGWATVPGRPRAHDLSLTARYRPTRRVAWDVLGGVRSEGVLRTGLVVDRAIIRGRRGGISSTTTTTPYFSHLVLTTTFLAAPKWTPQRWTLELGSTADSATSAFDVLFSPQRDAHRHDATSTTPSLPLSLTATNSSFRGREISARVGASGLVNGTFELALGTTTSRANSSGGDLAWSVAVRLALRRGVSLTFSLSTGRGVRLSVPVWLGRRRSRDPLTLCAACLASALWDAATTRWRGGTDDDDDHQRSKTTRTTMTGRSRREALEQQELMARQADTRRRAERAKPRGRGLVVVEATYGIADDAASSLDVTVPLQFWVTDDSELRLPASSKSRMLGFCDVVDDQRRQRDDDDDAVVAELRVVYETGGVAYEKRVSDGDLLVLPCPDAVRVGGRAVGNRS